MTTVIAVANHKGGVGKTSSTLYTGAALADAGLRVLLIDLDPQASLTLALGLPPAMAGRTVLPCLLEEDELLADRIVPAPEFGVDAIPASLDLGTADYELRTQMDADRALRRALAVGGPKRRHDVVLIDCPPSLGPLTVNALAAADSVLIPLETDAMSVHATNLLLTGMLRTVRRRLNPGLTLAGLLVAIHDDRTGVARFILAELRERFGEDLLKTVVPRRVAVRDAQAAGAARLPRNHPVAIAYDDVAIELMRRLNLYGRHVRRVAQAGAR